MNYLSAEEIKTEELHLLHAFVDVCSTLGLRYSLAGGTLLGAVRHHGFIPWDDDIDVCMARPDYENFCISGPGELRRVGLDLKPFRGTTMSGTPYIKVINPNILVQAEVEARPEKLWMDVLPVDGLPTDACDLERLYQTANRLRVGLILSGVKASSGSNVAKKIVKTVLRVPLQLPGVSKWLGQQLSDLGKSTDYGSTPYVGIVTWGLYGTGERMSLSGFEEQKTIVFEDGAFSCMAGWDEYLTGIYGDYMKLPPLDKRVSHALKAWREVK